MTDTLDANVKNSTWLGGWICSMAAGLAFGFAVIDVGYNGLNSFDPILWLLLAAGFCLIDLTFFPSGAVPRSLALLFYDPSAPQLVRREPVLVILLLSLVIAVGLKLHDADTTLFTMGVDKARQEIMAKGVSETGQIIKRYVGTYQGLSGHLVKVRYYDPSHAMHEKDFNINMIKFMRVRNGIYVPLHYMASDPSSFVLDNLENENYIELVFILILAMAFWTVWVYLKTLMEFYISS